MDDKTSITSAATILGVPRENLFRWARLGLIPCERGVGGRELVSLRELREHQRIIDYHRRKAEQGQGPVFFKEPVPEPAPLTTSTIEHLYKTGGER
jgi:hypothetical protein